MADNITSEEIQGIVSDNINSAITPINEKINALSGVVTSLYATMDRVANSLSLISDNLTLLQGGIDKMEAYALSDRERINSTVAGVELVNDGIGNIMEIMRGANEVTALGVSSILTAISDKTATASVAEPTVVDTTSIINAISAGNDSIIGAINAINIPEPTNITPVLEAISSINIPEPTDIQPVLTAINAINIPEPTNINTLVEGIVKNALVEYLPINANSSLDNNLTFAIAEVNSNVMEVKSILEEMADEIDLDVDDLSV